MIDMLSPAGGRAALGQLDVLLRTRGGGAAVSDRAVPVAAWSRRRPTRRAPARLPIDAEIGKQLSGRPARMPAHRRRGWPRAREGPRAGRRARTAHHAHARAGDGSPATPTSCVLQGPAGAACGVDRALACLCRGKPCQWPAM